MIRRMVLRTNAERKRPGPTVLSVNQRYMPVESIKIIADGKPATRENLVVLIAMLMIDKAAKEQNDGMALAA